MTTKSPRSTLTQDRCSEYWQGYSPGLTFCNTWSALRFCFACSSILLLRTFPPRCVGLDMEICFSFLRRYTRSSYIHLRSPISSKSLSSSSFTFPQQGNADHVTGKGKSTKRTCNPPSFSLLKPYNKIGKIQDQVTSFHPLVYHTSCPLYNLTKEHLPRKTKRTKEHEHCTP
jgi:hypothetical protein